MEGSREGRRFIGAAIDGGVLSGGMGGEGVHWGSNRWRGLVGGREGVHWGSNRWRGWEGRGFIGAAIDGGAWWGDGTGFIGAAIDGGVLSGGTGGEEIHWGSLRWRGPECVWGGGGGGGGG